MSLSSGPSRIRPVGTGCQVRILSSQADCLHAHLGRLDAHDRQLRLGRRVERAAIGAFCTRARHGEPLVLGGFVDGRLVASAELVAAAASRSGAGGGPLAADLVLAVEAPFRAAGLATLLLSEAIHHAAWRQVALVRMSFAPDNVAMARLCTRFDATRSHLGDIVRAELCTGWLDADLSPILIESSPGFRPISMH